MGAEAACSGISEELLPHKNSTEKNGPQDSDGRMNSNAEAEKVFDALVTASSSFSNCQLLFFSLGCEALNNIAAWMQHILHQFFDIALCATCSEDD